MPGEPGSHMDMQFCADIRSIAQSMREIVAILKEDREEKAEVLEFRDLVLPKSEDLEPMDKAEAYELFRAMEAVRRGFRYLEAEVRAEGEEEPFVVPTGPNQPKTRSELLKALGGDLKALQDPYVQQLLAALPEEES